MVILNFVPQKLTTYELKNIKRGLRNYFEYADGSQCNITSLFFSEKLMSGQGALDNLYGADTIVEKLFDMEFLVSPRAYFCINTRGAETLINTIERFANLHKNMTLLDICCGTGAIGLSLAKKVGNVLGVDIAGDAVEDARRNAKMNKIENGYFVAGPAEDLIPQMIGQATHDEIVAVIDPPRTGIAMKAVRQLRASRIKKIIYVSSDPKSSIKNFIDLARPSSTTFFGDPFLPIVMQPLDLFPHTNHFMTVLLLVRVVQADLLHPHRANMNNYYGMLPVSTPAPEPPKEDVPPPAPGTDNDNINNIPGITEEQQAWLTQMIQTYGSVFEKDKWIKTMLEKNKEAGILPRQPVMVPAPRPPSPDIPPMPAFPVAPTSQDPAEYAKYKKDYDAYTDWYNKYATLYAAQQEKRKKTTQQQQPPLPAQSSSSHVQSSSSAPPQSEENQKLPDPNAVPRGVDPVAWRKYCNETREYYAKYKNPSNYSQPTYGGAFDDKKAAAERIADKIMNYRGGHH